MSIVAMAKASVSRGCLLTEDAMLLANATVQLVVTLDLMHT